MMKRILLGLLAGMLIPGAGTMLNARNVAPRLIRGSNFVPHELLVKFKSGTPAFVRKDIHRGASARLVERFSGDSRLEHIRLPENENLDAAIAYYSTRADVEYVQRNFIYRPLATPNDALYGGQWALAHMNAPAAWDKATGRFTVVVALIDTGVDYTHPDLALNIWTNPAEAGLNCTNGVDDDPQNNVDGLIFTDDCRGWNFWDNNNDPMDLNGHGTMMAGAMGAMGNDAIGIAGANWDIQIMPLKVTDPNGSSTTAIAIQALDYAIAHAANLVNYSMGTSGFDPAFRDAVLRSQNAGQLFITAAGNQTADNDFTPFYPCDFTQVSINNPTPPANIVCAASTNQNDVLSSNSNYGTSTVQLGAPGESIVTTFPLSLSSGGDPYVVSGGGTSFSSAFVAGGAALLKGCNASLSFDVIRDILLTNVAAAGLPTSTGGIVNYSAALADARVGTCDSTATSSIPLANAGGPYIVRNPRKILQLDGTASSDTGGQLLLYFWDFGDGTYAVGPQAAHIYSNRGTSYAVTLFVRDNQGVISHQTTTVSVGPVKGGPAALPSLVGSSQHHVSHQSRAATNANLW